MTKQILLLLNLLPLIGFGQTTTLSSADVDSDGCVTVSDVLGVLQFFGQCSGDTTGANACGENTILYYFHGFDDLNQEPWATESGSFAFASGFCEPNADYYLANTIGGGQDDINWTIRTLDEVMSYLIDNVTVGNYSMITTDIGGCINAAGTENATVLNFPATPGVDAQYYFAVPHSLTPTDFTTPGSVNLTNQSDGTSALGGQAADRKSFSYEGVDYWLYRMSTPSQGQTYLGFNN